jgi:hypothetical protein
VVNRGSRIGHFGPCSPGESIPATQSAIALTAVAIRDIAPVFAEIGVWLVTLSCCLILAAIVAAITIGQVAVITLLTSFNHTIAAARGNRRMETALLWVTRVIGAGHAVVAIRGSTGQALPGGTDISGGALVIVVTWGNVVLVLATDIRVT